MGVRFIKGINGSEKIKFLKSAVINNDNSALLLHMDGANGSTTFTDSSLNNFAVTANGDANITTANYQFGGASASFITTNSYLTTDSLSNFGFGTGDFTIEMWAYKNYNGAYFHGIICINRYDDNGILFRYQPDGYGDEVSDSLYIGGQVYDWYATTNFPINQWNHLALVRKDGIVTIYVNGSGVFSVANANDLGSSGIVTIGASSHNYAEIFNGYIDEVRITKGAARYTADFDPPTAPFGNTIIKNKIRFIKTAIDTTWLLVFNKVNGVDTNITAIACYAANEGCLDNLDNCINSAFDCFDQYDECLYNKTQCETYCESNYEDDPDGYNSCINNCSSQYQCNNDYGYGGSFCNDTVNQCYIDYNCGFDLADCLISNADASQYDNQTVVTLNGGIFVDGEDYYLRLSNGLGVEQVIFQSLVGSYDYLDLILSNQMPLLQSLSFTGCAYENLTITAPNGTNATALNFSACGNGSSFIFNPTAGLANISSLNITNSNSSENFTINDISVMTNLSTFTLNGDIIADAADRNFYIGGMSTPMHADKVLMVLMAVNNSTIENTFWVDGWNACQTQYSNCSDNLYDCLYYDEYNPTECRNNYNECIDYEIPHCYDLCYQEFIDSSDDWDGYYDCLNVNNCDGLCDAFDGGALCDQYEQNCYNNYPCDSDLENCYDSTGRYNSSYSINLKVETSTYTGAVADDIQSVKQAIENKNITVSLTFD